MTCRTVCYTEHRILHRPAGHRRKPLAHQTGYTRVFRELAKFTFNIRISEVLSALQLWLLTKQSLFVPPDVFRALSQQFLQLHQNIRPVWNMELVQACPAKGRPLQELIYS